MDFKTIDELIRRREEIKALLDECNQELSDACKTMCTVQGKTGQHNGKYYTFSRRNDKYFVRVTDRPWGSWHKNKKNNN